MSGAFRRSLIWIAGLAVLAALLGYALVPSRVAVDLARVDRGPLEVTLGHEGKTRARQRFVISAPLAGRVRRIDLEPGDPVVANETVLAIFEPRDPELLDARTQAEAGARVDAAQAALESTRAEKQQARAQLDFAENELARTRRLASQGIVSDERLDAAEVEAKARREALQGAGASEQRARFELEAARARLLGPAPAGSPGRVIELRSPVDGVVLRRIRQSASVVPLGEVLLEVADAGNLEVVADFLSTDAVRIQPGMPVVIDGWGGTAPLAGRVRRIEPAGFMKLSALGVEEQRVNVIVDFVDPREAWSALGDEYRVEVSVITWQGTDVLRVPTSSLFRDGAHWAVFAVTDGRAALRRFEPGHRNNRHVEVLDGLDEGEEVVVHPSDEVGDGTRIRAR